MSTKKRGTIWLTLVFSMVFLIRIVYSEEIENFKPKFSIKLTGGYGYVPLGDINEFLDTRSDLSRKEEIYWSEKFFLMDEIKNINYGLNFEGELRINISSKFAVAVGTEYIHAKKESYLILRGKNSIKTYTARESYEPKITIIPVKLGIYYKLPLLPRTSLLFNIGGGYYFAKSSLFFDQHEEWSSLSYDSAYFESFWTEHTYKFNGGNFGFHGGIGFEYSLGKNLSLVIEGQGRYVKIKELKGKDIMITSWGDKKKIYGILWYYNREMENKIYTYLTILDRSSPDLPYLPSNIRKAALNLSGFSLRIGIRIKLF